MSLLGFGSPFADIFMAMTMDKRFNEPKDNFGISSTPDIWDEEELDNDYFSDYESEEDF